MLIRGTLPSPVFRASLVALFLALSAGVLAAQEGARPAQADTVPTYTLEGFQITVSRPTSTGGGASAVVAPLDSVGVRPASTLENVLRDMPLIQIRRNSRGEAQPALRGAEDRQIAVLMDGVPLTMGWDARTDLSIIPLGSARTIRLVRGLSSVLLGPNVLGGAVEVDVAAGPDRIPPPAPFSAGLTLEHTGAYRVQAQGGFRSEFAGGVWDVRGGGGFRDLSGQPLPDGLLDDPGLRPDLLTRDGDLLLNTDNRRFDGFVATRWQAEGGAWASLVASGIHLTRGVAPEAHVQDPRLWRYPDQTRGVVALSAGTGFVETPLGTGDVEVSLGVDLGRTDIEAFASEAYDDVVETERGDSRTLVFRSTADLAVAPRTDVRAAVTLGQVVYDEILDGGAATTYEQRLWSVAGEVEQRLGSRVRVTAGLSADGSDTPRSGDKPPLGTLGDWGGQIGISALALPTLRLHGNVSRRTRFPALRELYSGALGRFEPNPDLRPEEMVAVEGGFTWSVPGGASGAGELQAVAFHQRLRDGIVRSSVTDAQGNRKFKRVNQDEVRSTGLELLGSYAFGPLTFAGDLTLQRVRGIEPDGSEVDLEYEPPFMGKLSVGYALPWDLSLNGRVAFWGEQFCQNPEIGGLDRFSSDPRIDVGIGREFPLPGGSARGLGRRLGVLVGIDNVADAGIFDQCGLPQPGRLFTLGLSFS